MLKLSNVNVALNRQNILNNISFELARGQIGCFLGPSGCGKTTLLRTIAGFEKASKGEVELHGKLVTHTSVEQRKIGMVFQDFALFPHLNVQDNIAFGLQKMSAKQRQARVQELLELTNLSARARHYPHQLSGGQQQRVALARALAPKPDILLLDEPFSSIDSELREQLAHKIRNILKAENVTAILVTHDQLEAFAMADEIGVLDNGQLQQWDSAYQLYHCPSNRFVADFIGEGRFIKGFIDSNISVKTGLGQLRGHQDFSGLLHTNVNVLIRPDDIIHNDRSPLQAKVLRKHFRGANFLYLLEISSGEQILCYAPSHHNHKIGEHIGIQLEVAHIIVFPYQN